MRSSSWIRILTVFALFIIIGLGIVGGCETTEDGSDDGDTELRTCDLSGADSACEVCAEGGLAACCPLTSPA
jgi:hypothetical protein